MHTFGGIVARIRNSSFFDLPHLIVTNVVYVLSCRTDSVKT